MILQNIEPTRTIHKLRSSNNCDSLKTYISTSVKKHCQNTTYISLGVGVVLDGVCVCWSGSSSEYSEPFLRLPWSQQLVDVHVVVHV